MEWNNSKKKKRAQGPNRRAEAKKALNKVLLEVQENIAMEEPSEEGSVGRDASTSIVS